MGKTVLFDRYRLLEPAGSGGTAEVWRAIDERSGKEVAIKRLHPIVFGTGSGRRRLVREFQALRALRHPSIVRVRDLRFARNEAAIVLDYVPGSSVADRLRSGPTLEVREAVAIARDVAAALGAAHAEGIVHRDVTPGNILIDGEGRARLTDFGIARQDGDETVATGTGTLVGTLRYIAPEQLRGEPATPASDLFALGAVTYEMLAGRPAFAAATPVALVEAQHEPPPPLDGVPAAVDEAVRAALSPDPADRPASVEAFAEMLRAGMEPEPENAAHAPAAGARAAPTAGIAAVWAGASPATGSGAPIASGDAASAAGAVTEPVARPVTRRRRAPRTRASLLALAALVLAGLVVAAFAPGGPGTDPAGAGPSPLPTASVTPNPQEDGGKGNDKGKGKGGKGEGGNGQGDD